MGHRLTIVWETGTGLLPPRRLRRFPGDAEKPKCAAEPSCVRHCVLQTVAFADTCPHPFTQVLVPRVTIYMDLLYTGILQ